MHHNAFAAAACLALLVSAGPASAVTLMPAACPSSVALTKLDAPLPKLAMRLASDGPVTIVAIGSSSTAGAGATSPSASYPSRLQVALKERFPGREIHVVNRGINGQDGPEMLARFDADVVALKPTLVIWQDGVNALFRENGLATAGDVLHEAIRRTRALGADFLLIDPQYSPRVIADADTRPMVKLMTSIATEEGVAVFHRFATMQDWHERSGMAFETFLAKDSFHMNDWSYDCLARDLARSLAANVNSQQRSAEIAPNLATGVASSAAKPATTKVGTVAPANAVVPAAAKQAEPEPIAN